jgi:hypothetical protein
MLNLYQQLTGFIFVFSVIAVLSLLITFIKALTSTPPKPFEMTEREKATYGVLLSYIVSYLIYF